MSNAVGTSEQPKRAPVAPKSAAARNLASAEQLSVYYEQVFQIACQHGMRIPGVQALLLRNAAAVGSAAEPDVDEGADAASNEDAARSSDVSSVASKSAFWLGRQNNLRSRWRRVGAWSSPERGWLCRRRSLCDVLVALRVAALRSANVDRRIVDHFLDELAAYALDPVMSDELREETLERLDVPRGVLLRVSGELIPLRDSIRQERSRMVQQNRSLVAGIARRFVGKGIQLEDLMQEGTLGLLRAIDKFDPTRGFQFSTYAIWWIRQGISRAVLDQGRSVRIPVHLKEQTTRLRNVEGRLAHRLGRSPTRAELAQEIGLPETKVQHLQQQLLTDVSLQRPLHQDGDAELGDALEDESAVEAFSAIDSSRLGEHLSSALEKLDARSRFVVTAHLGLSGQPSMTLDGISQRLGISRERVRQIEREALLRLRRNAEQNHLIEYV